MSNNERSVGPQMQEEQVMERAQKQAPETPTQSSLKTRYYRKQREGLRAGPRAKSNEPTSQWGFVMSKSIKDCNHGWERQKSMRIHDAQTSNDSYGGSRIK